MSDDGHTWVRLEQWLVGDKHLELVPTGGVLELTVLAKCGTLQPARFTDDDVRVLDVGDPTRLGNRAEAGYWLTGTAGQAQKPLWQPRGAMFIVAVDQAPILTTHLTERPSGIPAVSRATLDSKFQVLDGYDDGQLDENLETTAAWRVLDQRTIRHGYFLDLEPALPAKHRYEARAGRRHP